MFGSGTAVALSKARSHSCRGPLDPPATNAIRWPSGDNANEYASAVGGVAMSRRNSPGPGDDRPSQLKAAIAPMATTVTPQTSVHASPRRPDATLAPTPVVAPVSASSISIRATVAESRRCDRSRTRQRRRSLRIGSGVSTGSRVQLGVSVRTEATVSPVVVPLNARRPLNISKSTHPKLHMSLRRSTLNPFACSGDMYEAVPRMTPRSVRAEATVGESRTGARQFRWLRGGPCKSEVEHLDDAIGSHFDIRRFQVAMHDADLVSGLERRGNLTRDRQRFIHRQPASPNPRREVIALDELHHQDAAVVIAPRDTVNLRDVWMVDRRQRRGFAFEPRHAFGIADKLIGEHLERDDAMELGVDRLVDFAHPAGAERALNLVRADARPWSKLHGCCKSYSGDSGSPGSATWAAAK